MAPRCHSPCLSVRLVPCLVSICSDQSGGSGVPSLRLASAQRCGLLSENVKWVTRPLLNLKGRGQHAACLRLCCLS